MRLSNSFKSALCTQLMKSDKEADDFVNAIMKADIDYTYNEDYLKD